MEEVSPAASPLSILMVSRFVVYVADCSNGKIDAHYISDDRHLLVQHKVYFKLECVVLYGVDIQQSYKLNKCMESFHRPLSY